MALLSHAAFLLFRLIITKDPSLHRRYRLRQYYDLSDFLTTVSASLLLHLFADTSYEESLGSPTFALFLLIACPALRPRGATYAFPYWVGDIAFWLLDAMGLSHLTFSGLNRSLPLTAYNLPVYA